MQRRRSLALVQPRFLARSWRCLVSAVGSGYVWVMDDQQKRGGIHNLTNAGKGRPKGVLNKNTKLVKEAIAEAFERLGGADRLVEWAQEDPDNEKVFYTALLPKLIPVQTELTGKDGGAILLEQKVAEDADAVTSRIAGLAERARAAAVAARTQH